MSQIFPLQHLNPQRFDTPGILKQLAAARGKLGELKGAARAMPNQGILINSLGIQEAKESSAIENIVTTHDDLFKEDLFPSSYDGHQSKEVLRYREALFVGYRSIEKSKLLTINTILEIQAALEQNNAGFRKLPGTTLKDGAGAVVYTPPQDSAEITKLMGDLESFINEPSLFDADPLIKMALIHHQFESIHPFYDGNGRTGRIINVLYLVMTDLLDIPILYLSRYILRTKADYYRLLQAVRDEDAWEAWVLYILKGVEETAADAMGATDAILAALSKVKHHIRSNHRFYSQDLINSLFNHPYTRIEFIQRDLNISRLTATRYLNALAEDGTLQKQKVGRSIYFINHSLVSILTAGQPAST